VVLRARTCEDQSKKKKRKYVDEGNPNLEWGPEMEWERKCSIRPQKGWGTNYRHHLEISQTNERGNKQCRAIMGTNNPEVGD